MSRETKTIEISSDAARRDAHAIIDRIRTDGERKWKVTFAPAGRRRRSNSQNKMLWALLGDISAQVIWHNSKMPQESWKEVFVATIKQQTAVPGIEGGFVVIGGSSRDLSTTEFSELIELIIAFGTQHDVEWSGDSNDAMEWHLAEMDRATEQQAAGGEQ